MWQSLSLHICRSESGELGRRHAVRGCMAVAAPPAGRLADSDSSAPRTPGVPAAPCAPAREPDTPGSVGVWVTPPPANPGNPGCGDPGAWSTPAPGNAGCRESGAAAGPGSGYPCALGHPKPAPRLPLTVLRSGWRDRLRADCLSRVQVSLHPLQSTKCRSADEQCPSVLSERPAPNACAGQRLRSHAMIATMLASVLLLTPILWRMYAAPV